MTACDLSACTKPWEIQLEIVKVIYQEFYAEVRVLTMSYDKLLNAGDFPSSFAMPHLLTYNPIVTR